MPSFGKKPSLWEHLLQHLIVFLICVVFPGLTTMMAPASWLFFERSGDNVNCTTWTCAYFVVPYKTQRVENVTDITQRERAGRTERKRKFGRTTNETVHVDGEGFLQIRGADDRYAEVSVSPVSLEQVVAKSQAFLNSAEEGSATIFALANWKFGGIMGGVLSLFTVLYVVGYLLGLLKLLLVWARKAVATVSPTKN